MLISELNKNDLQLLNDFVSMSRSVGLKPDYIQAGGGNTSIKVGDMMAVKCSGCQLKDMKLDYGYVCLPYKEIVNIFKESDRGADCESKTSAEINNLVIEFEDLPTKRPSVEAGFHALLGNAVIHTHAIYANVFNCIKNGEQKLKEILSSAKIDYFFFDFINPSADLAFAILDKKRELGEKFPHILFLKNHGLIVWADTVEEALEYNNKVLDVLKSALNLGEYPNVSIVDKGDFCTSDNKFIKDMLADGSLTDKRIIDTPLYPDQLVYLNANLTSTNKIELNGSEVIYNAPYSIAYSLEEALLAYAYLLKVADNNGYELETLPESGILFILGWDAEKYRSQMLK